MLYAARITLIQTLQTLLADEQAMIKKLRDRSIELDIERFAAELEAMERVVVTRSSEGNSDQPASSPMIGVSMSSRGEVNGESWLFRWAFTKVISTTRA